uniref:Uncharacterized protein n=1 Tax=viral metagenome TaxID=1070528 RepID=A0A6C0IRX5_9ZZZZ
MEIAIPLLTLGGLYVISNQNNANTKNTNNNNTNTNNNTKEKFTNMGIRSNLQGANLESRFNNYLPNTNVPPQNYPITNNNELVHNSQEYPNPNSATDKYLNQGVYQEKQRAGDPVSNNMQQVYSLSGNYMNTAEFTHNNMVPFTGPKARGQIYNNNNSETILDNYVGNGSQIVKKIEQAPLFKPQDNVQWTYGTPNMSEFYQSRVNPATKNNMVKPFESIRVGPGLDDGYTNRGTNGFNSGMEARDKWLPKTVDELRVSTNPKEEFSLLGHEGSAQSVIKNVGIQGKVEKYRPDTFFVNSQDRWLTTTGAEKATRMVSQEVFRPSNRNETTTYQQGTPNAVLKTASYVPKTYEETKRIQLEGYDVGHSVATGTAPLHHDKDNNHKSHTNYENSRSINKPAETFGSGFSSAIGAVMAPIMDILKPGRREEYTCNMRVYGNIAGEVPSAYVLNEGDVPGTTIKETTLYQPNGYINSQKDNAGYIVSNDRPISNQRDTTTINSYSAPVGTKQGAKLYDNVYRQTNNESKEKLVVGRTNQGNAKMFNSQVNMSMSKLDSDRENNRLWAPQATMAAGPSMQTYGKANMPQYYDQCQGCDRISPDLLTAFKENPYTQSLYSVA